MFGIRFNKFPVYSDVTVYTKRTYNDHDLTEKNNFCWSWPDRDVTGFTLNALKTLFWNKVS